MRKTGRVEFWNIGKIDSDTHHSSVPLFLRSSIPKFHHSSFLTSEVL
jgi:hypothetical protein